MSVHVYRIDEIGNRVEGADLKDYDEAYRLIQGRVSAPMNKRSEMAFQIFLALAASPLTGPWEELASASYAAVDTFLALEQ